MTQTDSRQAIAAELRKLVEQYFALGEPPTARLSGARLPLHLPSYGSREVNEALDSLLSTQVTMGRKVARFEEMWAEYLGVKHAIMVNSGSSANLLACSMLANPWVPNRLQPGDEVIVPAVAWSTSYFPLVNLGLVPVLVDVELTTFAVDPAAVERAITPKTRAILAVHLLGVACDMDRLQAICREHRLFLMEDACEAHGAMFRGRKVGSFGEVGSFSFYFSHHISTIEGGMLVTSDDRLADLARVLRAHGWTRDMRKKEPPHPTIDERYLFVNLGYNLRPTEIQAAFGLHQLDRLETFIEERRQNTRVWNAALSKYPQWFVIHPGREDDGSRSVWFGFPITVRPEAPFTRTELREFFETQGIETRPIMAGNFLDQPAIQMIPHRVGGPLPNAELITSNSFFIGNHQGVSQAEQGYVAECLEAFVGQRV